MILICGWDVTQTENPATQIEDQQRPNQQIKSNVFN